MKLRYVELPIERIYNRLGIENHTARLAFGEKYKDIWWTPEVVDLRNTFATLWIAAFDAETGHFTQLEKSMKEHGIARPISTVSGPPRSKDMRTVGKIIWHLPPDIPIKELIYTQPFGGSRITIAQKIGIKTIPCAVHDFSNLFPSALEITAKNFRKWFGNDYSFSSRPPHILLRKHLHSQNSKYSAMNGHTRQAQKRATVVAKKELNL